MLSNFAFLGDLNTPDLIIILLIILLLFGGRKLPELSKNIGKSMRNLREGLSTDEDKTKNKDVANEKKLSKNIDDKPAPLIDHLKELRRRFTYIVLSVATGTLGAYFIQQRLVMILLRPDRGQKLIYTSPGGGINFLFSLCLYFGLVISLPVIFYQVLKFVGPAIPKQVRKSITRFVVTSSFLMFVGIVFGYFLGLPVILKFLSHQFTTNQVVPLFTAQSYLSFVTYYLLGSSLLFQAPLILWIINKIKPQTPRQLFKYEKYVILISFGISAVLAPSINIVTQLIIALPIILSYQIGVGLVVFINRHLPNTSTDEQETKPTNVDMVRSQHLKPITKILE